MKITNKMRLLAVLFAAVMVCSIFAACTNERDVETTAPQKNEVTESSDQTTDTNEKEDATTSGSATVDTTEPAESTAGIVETTKPEESSSQVAETTEATETAPAINETTGEEKDTTETTKKEDDTEENECKHADVVVDAAKVPTCEDTGLTEGKHCGACGYVLVAQTVVGALGHNTNGTVEHKDATCTEDGVVGGTYCTACDNGKAAAEEAIKAAGHNTNGTVEHKDATCTEDGVVGGTYCDACDNGKAAAEAVIEATDHDMAAATCTAPATCKNECGHTEGKALGHDVKETYADKGSVRTYTKACVNCGGEKEYEYTVTFGEKKPLLFLNASQIVAKASSGTSLGGAEISADGSYATISNQPGAGNGFFFIADNGAAIGQYVMIKYKTTNEDKWEWYVKSKGQNYGIFHVNTINDGTWQTIILDLSKSPDGTYVADAETGKYHAAAIRWAIMKNTKEEKATVDVAFVAVSDNIDDLLAVNDTANGNYVNYRYFDSNKVATDVRPVSMYFNLTSPSGIKGAYSCAQEFDKELNTSTTAGKERNLYYQGWVAVDAEVTGIQFRVVTADGASEWKTPDPYVNSGGAVLSFNKSTDKGVLNNSQVVNYPNRIAYNFWGWANLSEYAGQTVTVEYAMVTADGDIIPFYTCNTVAVAK